MDIEQIRAKLYEDFDAEGIVERREKAKQDQSAAPRLVDLYQQAQDRIYEVSQKSYPKGSSAIVNTAVASVIDGAGAEGLARAYKRAKEDVSALNDQGERGRAEIRRQQYMQEDFLPAVEIVANSASPDELLANERALKELDQYVLLPGKASGNAYTASYLRQAYGNLLGQTTGRSDASVRSGIRRLNALLDDGSTRAALGVANDLKKKIDEGSAQADDVDYELLSRVTSYYS